MGLRRCADPPGSEAGKSWQEEQVRARGSGRIMYFAPRNQLVVREKRDPNVFAGASPRGEGIGLPGERGDAGLNGKVRSARLPI